MDDDQSKAIEETFLQALDSGPVKNFVNPITKHLGETLGYIGDIVRFYSHQNLAKIFKKWAETQRGGKTLEEDEFKRVMPLLPLAAQVSDDELQQRWAALLESAARGEDGFLPSFGQTLSQLTAEEAKYLERLDKAFKATRRFGHPGPYESLIESRLLTAYDPELEDFLELPDTERYENFEDYVRDYHTRFTAEELAALRRNMRQAELFIKDLERLGILEITELQKGWQATEYAMSVYGRSFTGVVAPKKSEAAFGG